MSNILRCIHGHTSPETAFVFNDWPFGFSLRCRRRVWLEFKPKHGFRFVSQTTNPKRGDAWNKPHYSTYSEAAVLVWVKSDESPTGESLHWTGLSLYSESEKISKFEKDYAEAIAADENLRKQVGGIKMMRRIGDAQEKLQRIYKNALAHLNGEFNCEAFVKLFEGDHAFGNAIADKWMRLTAGVGSVEEWLRAEFREFMQSYHEGWEKAKACKPEGYKLLSPRMDTIQEGDLFLTDTGTPLSATYGEQPKEWTPSTLIGEVVQSHGYYCRRKE